MSGLVPNLIIQNPESNIANFGAISHNSGLSTFTYEIKNSSYGSPLEGGSIEVDTYELSAPYSTKCYNGLTEQASEISCGLISMKKGSNARISILLDSTFQLGVIADQVIKINNFPIIVKGSIIERAIINNIALPSSSLSSLNIDPRSSYLIQTINVQSLSKFKTVSIQSPAIGSVVSQSTGKIIMISLFTRYDGLSRNRMAL